MMKAKIKGIVTIVALAGFNAIVAGTACATPQLNEPFDEYANGTTLDTTGNWTNFSGTTLPFTVNAGTVTATNVGSGTTGEDDSNKFAAAPITTGLLYLSTLVTVPTGTTVTATNGDYFFAPYSTASSGGGYAARVYVAQGSAAGTVAFGLTTAAANTTNNPVNKTADLTLGTEYKLVIRYDITAKTATMGLFAPGTAVTLDSQLTVTSGTAGTVTGIDSVAIRQGAGAAFTTVIDGIQAGTTLADVSAIATGSSTYFNAVPEPSSYALGAFALVVLSFSVRCHRRAA